MNYVQPIRSIEKIEEVKSILLHQSYRNYFMFVMGINTGLRISDLLPLKVKDVRDKEYIVAVLQKTKNTKKAPKKIPINNDLKSEINKYTKNMGSNDYLFPSQKGGHIKRVQAYDVLRKAAGTIGIDEIGTHTLRKTFGYHFYKKTKDVALLQEIFGHSAPSVTLRYIGINQDEIDNALRDFSL